MIPFIRILISKGRYNVEEIPIMSEMERLLLSALYQMAEEKYVEIFQSSQQLGQAVPVGLVNIDLSDGDNKRVLARVNIRIPPFEMYEFIILWDLSNYLIIKFDGVTKLSRPRKNLTKRRLPIREAYTFLKKTGLDDLWSRVCWILDINR